LRWEERKKGLDLAHGCDEGGKKGKGKKGEREFRTAAFKQSATGKKKERREDLPDPSPFRMAGEMKREGEKRERILIPAHSCQLFPSPRGRGGRKKRKELWFYDKIDRVTRRTSAKKIHVLCPR